MADELREILKQVFSKDRFGNTTNDIIKKTPYSLLEDNFNNFIKLGIDQAIPEIKSLLKSKLPKKIIIVDKKSDYDRAQGYNQILTEIEKIIEEL